MDVSRLSSMGWTASTDLRSGVEQTYEWFKANEAELRQV
jgi:nucleoside-diphosphate-sugar epimerase